MMSLTVPDLLIQDIFPLRRRPLIIRRIEYGTLCMVPVDTKILYYYDVDGFEVKVLSGAIETITRNKPAINIEMKKEKRPYICMEIRKILGGLSYYPRRRTRSDIIWTK